MKGVTMRQSKRRVWGKAAAIALAIASLGISSANGAPAGMNASKKCQEVRTKIEKAKGLAEVEKILASLSDEAFKALGKCRVD